ncbi:MAG TPA: hypothetical protein VHH88_04885 [Verrucomicrobiae bacterium]|nr:hypothetical protein [Verrucomicrobiae bacterium]
MQNRSAEEIKQSTERLLQELKAIVRESEELLEAGVADVSESGRASRERLAAALEVAKTTGSRLRQRAIEGAQIADDFAHQYPYRTIGVAFAIGLLAGVIAKRT